MGGEGLLDAPGDWLVQLGLVVTAGPLNWLGYVEKFHGAGRMGSFGRYNEHFSVRSFGSRHFGSSPLPIV